MSKATSIAFAVAGVGGAIAVLLGNRKAEKQATALKDAISSGKVPDDVADDVAPAIVQTSAGPQFAVHATGYWPYSAREDEKQMEGGVDDRKGKPIITLEMHTADPVKYPYVSVSGDDNIFPYGQRLSINAWPGKVFRVVDTGSHFRGTNKVYRVMGEEPLDFAVDSSKTEIPKRDVLATIVVGDTFDKSTKVVAADKFKGQSVAVGCGLDLLGAESV